MSSPGLTRALILSFLLSPASPLSTLLQLSFSHTHTFDSDSESRALKNSPPDLSTLTVTVRKVIYAPKNVFFFTAVHCSIVFIGVCVPKLQYRFHICDYGYKHRKEHTV